MSSLARQQMYHGRFFSADEITAEVDRVTAAHLQRLAKELFVPERLTLTLLGNLGSLEITRANLVC
jgi:predicted Zn-dependent peptidase